MIGKSRAVLRMPMDIDRNIGQGSSIRGFNLSGDQGKSFAGAGRPVPRVGRRDVVVWEASGTTVVASTASRLLILRRR